LVSAVAVPTVEVEYAAARIRGSHSGVTTTSLLRITTSARPAASNASFMVSTKPLLEACLSMTTVCGGGADSKTDSSTSTLRRSQPQSSTISSGTSAGVCRKYAW
jgi:hypothetical protein